MCLSTVARSIANISERSLTQKQPVKDWKRYAPGQQSPLPQRLKPASIRGKLVYENSGKLIAGVKVKLSPLGYEATTDSKGEFEFNDWETHRIQEGKEYRIQFPHPKKEKEVVLKMVELKYGGEERWQMSQLI